MAARALSRLPAIINSDSLFTFASGCAHSPRSRQQALTIHQRLRQRQQQRRQRRPTASSIFCAKQYASNQAKTLPFLGPSTACANNFRSQKETETRNV